MTLTPEQISAIHIRITATCTNIEIRPWNPTSRYVEVSQFDRSRLIETVKVTPGGIVTVIA